MAHTRASVPLIIPAMALYPMDFKVLYEGGKHHRCFTDGKTGRKVKNLKSLKKANGRIRARIQMSQLSPIPFLLGHMASK